ncbi:c-type cytochrome [Caulobacter hibisci]|uniref:Cytochrome c n=1 Tax=Caulobacter hibisci TaxID=2035993 RepID=A0ABS0T3V3_9CAUL|nr:cytochrome c [Caulobacter hibisci]MBI1685573.1 cytochrome c [Caulobacter hibisci]
MLRNTIFATLVLTAAASPVWAAPQSGQTLYADNCSACHQVTGKGVKGAFPTLVGAPIVQGDGKLMAGVVLNGRAGMPAFKDDLSDADLTGILNYVRGAWGNKGKPVSFADVASARAQSNAKAKARGLQAH